jgi:hypothetical protein
VAARRAYGAEEPQSTTVLVPKLSPFSAVDLDRDSDLCEFAPVNWLTPTATGLSGAANRTAYR